MSQAYCMISVHKNNRSRIFFNKSAVVVVSWLIIMDHDVIFALSFYYGLSSNFL